MNSSLNIFKILAEETRLRILNLFIKSNTNLCVCEIMDALQLPQYAVSKAINQIKKVGLLNSTKSGTWVYYELNKNADKNKPLYNFLKSYLNDNIFMQDEQRLNNRLILRMNNKCVVGIVPEKDLLKMIKQKTEA